MGRRRISEDGTTEPGISQQEAEVLSAMRGAALVEGDPDAAELNNPDVEELGEPPLLGGRPRTSPMFGPEGDEADTVGRATSPKLYASTAQFPTATQFRVWRWENGIPVALGAIDCEASEDDFIRMFYNAMPKPGDGRYMYKFRPVDIRGQEIGKEFTYSISEDHATLTRVRERKRREEEERMGHNGRGDVIVQPGDNGSTQYMAEEMGRMFEGAIEAQNKQVEQLTRSLEEERNRLREEERARMNERLQFADRATGTVQTMTEKLMETDKLRSKEAMEAQKAHSEVLLSTLTTTFTQQQAAAREHAKSQQELDARRADQDRAFYDRQQKEAELRRKFELEEVERRRKSELDEVERRRSHDSQEWERRRSEERERAALEAKEAEDRRKYEAERERERLKDERERWRTEIEERRRQDKEEWERREANRREDIARDLARRQEESALLMRQMEMTAQRDREHNERLTQMAQQEREHQREVALQREKMEREARESIERERQRQFDLAAKEMENSKERDREHAERMLQLSKIQAAGSGSLTELLGMETKELLERVFTQGGNGDGSWANSIPQMLGSLADLAKTVFSARGQQQGSKTQGRRPISGAQPQMIPVQTSQGIQYMPAGQTFQAQPTSPAPASAPEKEQPAPSKAASTTKSAYEVAKSIGTLRRAREAGVGLQDQKKARQVVRKLGEELAKAPEDQWLNLILQALKDNEIAVTYIQAVTVYAALAEAHVEENLADRIVSAMRTSGLVPADFPYDEADLAAATAVASATATAAAAPEAVKPSEKADAEPAPAVTKEE